MKKRIFSRDIFWHCIAIAAFILYELRMIFILGSNAGIADFVIFYLADIAFFYLTTYWLLPWTNEREKLPIRILAIPLWIILFSFLFLAIVYALYTFYGLAFPMNTLFTEYYKVFWRVVFLFSIALGFWYARYSIRKEREARSNELLALQAREGEARMENALLRAQVNPHLMYNVLAGIHAQLFRKSPELARTIILLSEIMEVAMQGSERDKTFTLADEVAYMKKLVDLYGELHKGKMYVELKVGVGDSVSRQYFPSMLLMNIVENIFRHGVVNEPDKPAYITIADEGNTLRLTTENAIAPRTTGVGRKSTGLENTRRRLERHFADRHKLKTGPENDRYFVELTIRL